MKHGAYTSIPNVYYRNLKSNGNRKKARCFKEYFDDMELNEKNSIRFYAKSWEVSVGTAHKWVDDFKEAIDNHFAYWHLKNQQQYNYVKNQTEHQPNTNRTQKQSIKPYNKGVEKQDRTPTEHQLNEEKIIYNNNTPSTIFTEDIEFDKYFNELRFINKRYAGSKDKAYKSYLQVKEYLNIKILVKAYRSYITEVKDSNDKGIGFSRFINENLYLPYLPKEIAVTRDNDTIEGVYENEKLSTDTGVYEFSSFRYLEKLKNKEITFKEVA